MSDKNLIRRAEAEITFDGTDITSSIRPYLLSVRYTDNEEDETDDLQIRLQDRDGIWLTNWLNDAIHAAAQGPGTVLRIACVILRKNWLGDGGDTVLDCGQFELDSINVSGLPQTVTIKATSLPYTAPVRQTGKTRAWEAYNLSGIAREIAGAAGMTCMYESASDPYYDRVEQYRTSDISFLATLCHEAGISLKATNSILVLFDQSAYEAKDAVCTFRRGAGAYLNYKLDVSTADAQYASCRVSYVVPATGQCIEGTATADNRSGQQLEIHARVSSAEEAREKAAKLLRLHNKFARTASFTVPGNPNLVAGVTVQLEAFGGWDGKYIVRQADHTVDASSGYTTQISLRRVLEGY